MKSKINAIDAYIKATHKEPENSPGMLTASP